jgi:hypothetical protein
MTPRLCRRQSLNDRACRGHGDWAAFGSHWQAICFTVQKLSTLLAAIAEFERELIRERTGEGRKRAKARGVRFGRPSKLTDHQKAEVLGRIAKGDSLADIARTYNVDATTIGRVKPMPEMRP